MELSELAVEALRAVSGTGMQRSEATHRRRATLLHVASACGVSVKTVSRVVNGEPGVAVATRKIVQAAIEEFGYQPNLTARSLRQGRDTVLAMAVPSITAPFFAEVIATIEALARSQSFVLIVSSITEGSADEAAVVGQLCARGVAGLILAPSAPAQTYLASLARSTPIVCIDRPPNGFQCDTVLVDNEFGAYTATKRIIHHGHTRIGFLGGPFDKYTICERYKGYIHALNDAGITLDEDLIVTDAVSSVEVAAAVPKLLSRDHPPTAIFTSSSKASLGLLEALPAAGQSNVMIAGFDDFPGSGLAYPAVSVVKQDGPAIAKAAFDLLLGRVAGRRGRFRHVVVPTSLVQSGRSSRESLWLKGPPG